jgi:hypothetical protein
LRVPPAPGQIGHIAVSDGFGGTVEAKGRQYGVVADVVHGRDWSYGVLIPGIIYDAPNAMPVLQPAAHVYALGAPNMLQAKIQEIQACLAKLGFDPGPLDGVFGHNTMVAVAAFQGSRGLVVDGAVGPSTAAALGIALP